MAAARGEFQRLERLFSSRFRWSIGLYALGVLALLAGLALAWPHAPYLHDRLLSAESTAMLAAAMGIRLARDMLNLYGRSFKKDPFFVLELVQGLLSALLLPWAALQGGAQGLLLAWLGINQWVRICSINGGDLSCWEFQQL